jgi:hypothetical protein
MVDKAAALELIATHPWTALIVAADGELCDVVPFSDPVPSTEDILRLARRQGIAFRLVRQATLSEAELDKLVAEIKGAQDYSRTRVLRPGVNIPGRENALEEIYRQRSPLRRAWTVVAEAIFRLASMRW